MISRDRLLVGVFLGSAILVLAFFVLAEWLNPGWLMKPGIWLDHSGGWVAAASAGFLALDLVLPTPSSVVMTLNGKLFGTLAGSLINMVGLCAGGALAWCAGRCIQSGLQRFVSDQDRSRAAAKLRSQGIAVLILSRPIPIMAEAIAVTAGASGLSFSRYALGIFCGSLPISILYAYAGSRMTGDSAGLLVFLFVFILSALFWWGGRRFGAAAE